MSVEQIDKVDFISTTEKGIPVVHLGIKKEKRLSI